MTMACDVVCEQISIDFTRACSDLVRARHRQQEADSVLHRGEVAACQARIDMFLELHGSSR